MTQRIELFFECDSKFFLKKNKKKQKALSIELFFFLLQELNRCEKNDSQNWTLLFDITQRNWTLFIIWLQKLNFFIWLKEWNLFFSNMTPRNELFFKIWLTKLNFFWIWLTELNFFFEYDSQNWTFFLNMTHRIELFFSDTTQIIELFFWYDSKNWTPFFDKTQRIELLFVENDSTNWTLFHWLKELEFLQCDTKSFFHKHDSRHLTLLKIWLKN